MSWIDKSGYPWHLPVAQQLHITLVRVKPDPEMALHLAETAGLKTYLLPPGKSIFFLWKAILDLASEYEQLRDLLNEVVKELGPNHSMKPFFTELLDTGDAPVEAEPLNEDGTAKFISDNDTITRDESLLFKDDLTLPIGKLPALIKALGRLEELAPAVCRMIIGMNNSIQYGTGFRIGARTILTNHHVVHSKETGVVANAVTGQFGYDDDGADGLANSLPPYKFNVESIRADKGNDWAIIACDTDLSDSIPIIDISKVAEPKMNERAFIIQHPASGTKKIGFVRNTVSNFNEQVVHYLTDTQEGSSGAPVFNQEGLLIAIHHAGGLPVKFPGQAPVKKNEGIRISKILDDFKAKNIQIV
jgi:V8-like Glu-specific endopeptidase